jgi:hypothetical protein
MRCARSLNFSFGILGMALFGPRSGRSSRVLLVPNCHQIVIQNENYQRRQRKRQSLGVLVRLDHLASGIVDANHSVMRTAGKLRVADCVADGVWLAIPQPTERQRIGD